MKMRLKLDLQLTCGSERKDLGWKYSLLPNEKDLNTIICIFCDKVTKGGI